MDEGPILNALEALQLELADVAAFTTSYRKSLDGRDKYFYYHKARDKPKRNLTEDNLKLKRLLELKSYYHENKEGTLLVSLSARTGQYSDWACSLVIRPFDG